MKKFTVEDIDNIDINNLPEEFLKQPGLYRYFATIGEDALMEVDRLDERLKVVDAEIDKELRHNAEMNSAKITEKAIASEILLHKRHREAYEDYIQAKHDARILINANTKALEHRKKSLEKLADFELNGYNSTPKQPRERKESMKDSAADRHQIDYMDKKSKIKKRSK